jgi:hypothetical protein
MYLSFKKKFKKKKFFFKTKATSGSPGYASCDSHTLSSALQTKKESK